MAMTKEHSQQIRTLRASLKKNMLLLDQIRAQISTDTASLLTLVSGVQTGDVLRFHKEPGARLPEELKRWWWETGYKVSIREISFYPHTLLGRNPLLDITFELSSKKSGRQILGHQTCRLLLSVLHRFFTKVKVKAHV
jgi:hypothetical protein